MIWGAIQEGIKASLILWQQADWSTIMAQHYCTHVLNPVHLPFWHWDAQQANYQVWLMEDGASAHRA